MRPLVISRETQASAVPPTKEMGHISHGQRMLRGMGSAAAIGAGYAVERFLFKNPYDQMSLPGILFGGLDALGIALGYSAVTGNRLEPAATPTEGSE